MSFVKICLTAIIAGGLVPAASAQTTLSLAWKVQAGSTGNEYLAPSGDASRGMFLNPSVATGGSLLVASRTNGNFVRRIDTATGELKDPAVIPNDNYLTTSTTFVINKVVVSDDGVIYVMSLGLVNASAEQHFRIYRHADEFSPSSLACDIRTDSFSGNGGPGIGKRIGDDADIIGTGNDTKILACGATGGGVHLFTTADGGMTFTHTELTGVPDFGVSTTHLAWDPTVANRFYFRSAGGDIARTYDISGSTATEVTGAGIVLPDAVATPAYGPFDIGSFDGEFSAVFGIGNSTAGTMSKPILVFRMSDLSVTYQGFGSEFPFPEGSHANGNAAGDIQFDSTNNVIYSLFPNNSLTKFVLPASVNDWNLY